MKRGSERSVGIARQELEPLVEEGLTLESIAQRIGVSDSTVKKWLKRHDLRTRGAQRRVLLDRLRDEGERDIQVVCRKHGLTRHVSVASERRLRCATCRADAVSRRQRKVKELSLIHISEPTRPYYISYAVFCL